MNDIGRGGEKVPVSMPARFLHERIPASRPGHHDSGLAGMGSMPVPDSAMATLPRWSPPAMGPLPPRLVLFTGTVPAGSASARHDTMLAFVVSAVAESVSFRPRTHGSIPLS